MDPFDDRRKRMPSDVIELYMHAVIGTLTCVCACAHAYKTKESIDLYNNILKVGVLHFEHPHSINKTMKGTLV